MKHFTILKSFLLLFALVVGSNVWAEDPDVTYDFTGTDWTVSNGTLSNGTVSFTGAGGANFKMNSGYFMLGKSGAYINFPTYTSAVEKIVVTGRSGASASVKQNIYVGDVAVSTETEGATGTNTYEIDENYQDAGTQYTLKVTSNHNTQITKIEVFFASGSGTSEKKDCNLALTGTTDLEFDLYKNADAQVINYTTSSTGAVTVASSEYIDAEVGDGTITVTPKKKTNGAVEITVNQAADDTYKAGSATFTVNIANSTPKTGAWELTALADLEEGDVFVIVGNNGNNYAMSNDNGTGSAPAAVAVTVEDDEITSDVDDNIKWNISGDATNGYTFYPNGDSEKWLYCTTTAATSNNNNMRVGTGDRKLFVLDADNHLLTIDNYTNRYVSIYNNSDWRGYVNTTTAPTTLTFYKYVDGTTPQKANPELAFSPSEVNINFGDQFTAPTLSAAAGFDGTVEYSSSNETVAFVTDTETGDLNIIGGGTTVITATFAGNDTFKSGSASYTLTVTDNRIATTITQENITLDITEVATLTQLTPVVKDADENVIAYTYEGFPPTVSFDLVSDENGIIGSMDYNSGEITLNGVVGTATLKAYYNIYNVNDTYKPSECTFTITVADLNGPGTENNPYSVAEAIAATPTTAEVYIKGIVSSFYYTSIVGDGSNYRYYISDDGTTATQLLVYKGKGLNNTAFANADDLLVGDEVVIYGKLVTYQNAPEVASGNYLISLNRPVVPTITLEQYEYNVNAAGGDKELPVTCTNMPADPQLSVEFVESDGETAATYDWITAEINNSGNIDGHIDANTGDARTAYFKVKGVDADNNTIYSNLITITQAAPAAPSITVKKTSIDFVAGGESDRKISFEYESLGNNPTFEVVFFDEPGTTVTTYDWVTKATIENNEKVNLSVDQNNGDARKAYFKIRATGTDIYSDLVTITQAAYEAPIVPAVAGEGAFVKVTSGADLTNGTYLIVYEGDASHDAVAFDGSLSTLDAAYNGIKVNIVNDKIESSAATVAATFEIKPANGTIQSKSGYYIYQSSYGNGLTSTDDPTKALDNTFEIDDDGNAVITVTTTGGSLTLRYNYAENQLRFRYYKSGQQSIALYKYVAEETPFATVKFNANGFATFSSVAKIDLSVEKKFSAWEVTEINGEAITFNEVTSVVPANTGLLIKRNAQETDAFAVLTVTDADATALADNLLVGCAEPKEIEADQYYGLSGNQFVRLTAGTVPAGKAILPAALISSNAPMLSFIFNDGETTKINLNVNDNLDQNAPRYNMAGQRVSNSYKGIVIVNGKKYIVK